MSCANAGQRTPVLSLSTQHCRSNQSGQPARRRGSEDPGWPCYASEPNHLAPVSVSRNGSVIPQHRWGAPVSARPCRKQAGCVSWHRQPGSCTSRSGLVRRARPGYRPRPGRDCRSRRSPRPSPPRRSCSRLRSSVAREWSSCITRDVGLPAAPRRADEAGSVVGVVVSGNSVSGPGRPEGIPAAGAS